MSTTFQDCVPSALVTAEYIGNMLFNHCPRCDTEAELQTAIGEILKDHAIQYKREWRLNEKDRIDFLIGGLGIEVKITGSRSDLIRQLHRYAQSEQIDSLVLVTTLLRHRDLPTEINAKPITIIVLENWA